MDFLHALRRGSPWRPPAQALSPYLQPTPHYLSPCVNGLNAYAICCREAGPAEGVSVYLIAEQRRILPGRGVGRKCCRADHESTGEHRERNDPHCPSEIEVHGYMPPAFTLCGRGPTICPSAPP